MACYTARLPGCQAARLARMLKSGLYGQNEMKLKGRWGL